MKSKIVWIIFLICFLFLFVIHLKDKAIDFYYEDDALAIYLNENPIDTIPKKESGYFFDFLTSSCTNSASVVWNNEGWYPIISNLSQARTKCFLHFRDYPVVTIYNGEEKQYLNVFKETNKVLYHSSVSKTILSCNNGVILKEVGDAIEISNVTEDTVCKYHDSSLDAYNNLDNSKSYWLYLKDETVDFSLNIQETMNLTIDLNGHSRSTNNSLEFKNYGVLTITSSSSDKGTINGDIILECYQNSKTILNQVVLSSIGSTIMPYDHSVLEIYNASLTSNNINTVPLASTLWTRENTNIKVVSSSIEGPFGIGGQGGTIYIDNSSIVGNLFNGINVNEGFSANITLMNGTSVLGKERGISMRKGSLTMNSTTNLTPTVRGNTWNGLLIINDQNDTRFNFYYGDIYGLTESNINALIETRAGTTLTTDFENQVYHMYLK